MVTAAAGVALLPYESLPEGQPWSLRCTRSVRPRAPDAGNLPTAQLTLFLTQVPRGRVRGLPTTSGGKRFQLWALGLFCTERHLAQRLKHDSFYPFTQQQPNGARGALPEPPRGPVLLAPGGGRPGI